VDLGCLGEEGELVVTDTLGHKVRFRAYRINESNKSFEVLGNARPVESLGEVTATAYLHRAGWSVPGEVVLKRSRARLYRGKTSHVLLGASWKSIECMHAREEPEVFGPYLSNLTPQPVYFERDRPFFLLIDDTSVRGQRQSGTTVELFGVERREFLDFVIGKLRVVLEFEGTDNAAALASNFLAAHDLRTLDASTTVDISRSTENVPPPKERDKSARHGKAYYRRESIDLRAKWPALAWTRWAASAEAHGAAFGRVMKEMEVLPDPNRIDLDAFDRFLRTLPPDTLFAAFLMDAASYVGLGFLGALGSRTRYHWTSIPGQPMPAMYFDEVNQYVSPAAWIAKVWVNKVPATLHATVAQWAFEIRGALAFRLRAEFSALGFSPSLTDGFKSLRDRLTDAAQHVPGSSRILGETHMEVRILSFGDYEVYYVTGEVIDESGSRYLPVMAVPFSTRTRTWVGSLDGSSPRSPTREDVAIVRFRGNDLVPLGVQLVNYPDLGPSFAEQRGPLPLQTIAVAAKGQVLTPRLRQVRPEFKDFLAPIDGEDTGVPVSPYASVLGLIETVEETTNPFTNLRLWRVGLNVSGFPCDVLVRKDRCDGLPGVGNHFTGRVWIAAKMEPQSVSTGSYIR